MKYGYIVYDRDGGLVACSLPFELYDTAEEANKAAEFWIYDSRYGSHEVEEVDDELTPDEVRAIRDALSICE